MTSSPSPSKQSSVAYMPWGKRRSDSITSQDIRSLPDTSRQRSASNVGGRLSFLNQETRSLLGNDSRLSSSLLSSSHREPIRSFINPATRDLVLPPSSMQQARSVREDTAELARYQLANATERQQSTVLTRNRSHSFRTSISADTDARDDTDSHSRPGTSEPIEERSESELSAADEAESILIDQGAADDDDGEYADGEEGEGGSPSLLTQALRRSPPHSLNSHPDDALVKPHEDGRIFDDAYGSDDAAAVFSDGDDEPVATDATDRIARFPALSQTMFSPSFSPSESTPLLGSPTVRAAASSSYDIEGQRPTAKSRFKRFFSAPSGAPESAPPIKDRVVTFIKSVDRRTLVEKAVLDPLRCMPAVLVGVLLNLLDALSYGMILFPLGTPVFSHLASAGISMFYVSTVIAQVVFSARSIFKGGVGSELIEVVPFFHTMALNILDIVGDENPDAVIATTITAYALSAVVTGSVFFLMGYFRFGYLVGFIPRHILVGCIGGVGWFLVATGFEVSARLDGNLDYNLDTLHKLLEPDTIWLWTIPLALAIGLFAIQIIFKEPSYLPIYILTIPAIFYGVASAGGPIDTHALRSAGWVFTGPPADEPWWYFYTLYKFDLVHWGAVGQCIPAMLALTFFGILHVPINVPALAQHLNEDHVNLDYELKLHGITNAVSGFSGGIQNYLVYANSLFFMRAGGSSRLGGMMLAVATFMVMLVGPQTIGYIPIMMVGCLIFDLGFELLYESVWEPRHKLKVPEFLTIIAIILVMGTYDFVVGIGVGVVLAFGSLIVQTSQVSPVRAMYAGDIVNSTVRRNHAQHHYLRQVGRQICIIKTAGYLFFGTIVRLERTIRGLIADEAFNERPIRYLVLDLGQVTGLDYSAGEAFKTISRLLHRRGISLILSGIDADGVLGRALLTVGIEEGDIEVKFLPDINTALELCENELLKMLYVGEEEALACEAGKAVAYKARAAAKPKARNTPAAGAHLDPASAAGPSMEVLASSPRRDLLQAAARESNSRTESRRKPKWQNFSEPLRLMLQIFDEISDKNEDFWFRATRFFVRREFAEGEVVFRAGDEATGFYMLQKGIVRAEYDLPHGQNFHESIVAGTTLGELPFFSETKRTAKAVAEMDCVSWVLDKDAWARLQKEDPEVAHELLRISLKLTAERMATVPSSTMLLSNV